MSTIGMPSLADQMETLAKAFDCTIDELEGFIRFTDVKNVNPAAAGNVFSRGDMEMVNQLFIMVRATTSPRYKKMLSEVHMHIKNGGTAASMLRLLLLYGTREN